MDEKGLVAAYQVLEFKVNTVIENAREIRAEVKEVRGAITHLENEIAKRDKALSDREQLRAEEEKQRYLTAIRYLIWIIGILGGLLWAYRAIIIGSPPGT